MSRASKILKLQGLASLVGKLEREKMSASPSRQVILQIELQTLKNQMTLETQSLKKEEWRVC